MHRITATAAKIAVDMIATELPNVSSNSKTINSRMQNQLAICNRKQDCYHSLIRCTHGTENPE